MTVIITPGKLKGKVKAIASKSMAHRLLIAASLSDRPSDIICQELSDDINATVDSLNHIGAQIRYDKSAHSFRVIPIQKNQNTARIFVSVRESGSTLRFLLPVICALGINAVITMDGRLPERPLAPLLKELERHGCTFIRNTDGSIETTGKLSGGEFRITANVSSQFISGLLFALPLIEKPSYIRLLGPVESEDYIHMTVHALKQFGIETIRDNDILTLSHLSSVPKNPFPQTIKTEGDWSNGAFWEIADMLSDGGKGDVICEGLDENSVQGDRAVRELKYRISAGNSVIESGNIPDLIPVLSVLASVSPGCTTFIHAGRLRLKESDRIHSTAKMIVDLGGKAKETDDGIIFYGVKRLRGGIVDSSNDHRIAMSAAVASIACDNKVIITGAETVNKSYPGFWDDFINLGGKIDIK